MVKGKTKSGIKFVINENIKKDVRVLMLLRKMQNADLSAEEQSDALFKFLEIIFGSEKNLSSFMDSVAEKNEGACTPEMMMSEINEMFEVLGLKNS